MGDFIEAQVRAAGLAWRWSCILHFQPYTPMSFRLFSMDQERRER